MQPISQKESLSTFEIRLLDHTANMNLAFALIINSGVNGITDKLILPQPYNGDPFKLTEEERIEFGITKLPNTFDDRKKAIYSEEGDQIREFLGEDVV